MTTFGEVKWEDNAPGEGKNSKDLWLRLESGPNEVRLLTQPFQYLMHKYKKEGDPGFGQKVYCSAIHGSCPLCDAGDKAKPRWLLGVIDRRTGTYKILDISWAVYQQIKTYAQNTKSWGDPTKYDLNIVVNKNGGATGYYTVQPVPKEPLSATDQQIKDNVDFDDLKRRVTPPNPEQVQKRIDKINGANSPSLVVAPTSSTSKPKAKPNGKPQVTPVSMDDDDESFPAYTG
jgi:hypothetical protein